jgi:YD repeat-containing protein
MLIRREKKMPSKIRYGLIIGIAVVGLFFASVLTSYAESVTYTYDELNRLIRVEYGDGLAVVYTYDKAGNRSQVYSGIYTLAVNVVGGGTVIRNPNQSNYSAGTSVTLTAFNGFGTFSEWSGDLTGNTNPTTIIMDGNKSVTATFVAPGGWLEGWAYRKSFTLSRASGAVTNYQMKLLVGESSGAVGYNVHCDGHVLSSFNDLRFTNLNGDVLDYWIESISGTTPNQLATVWIKFDSIGTDATTFYMYYGKADAPAVSNGTNTFIVFDDFERGNDGDEVGGIWTVDSGTLQISTGQKFGGTRSMKLVGAIGVWPYGHISQAASNNIAIRFRLYKQTNARFDIAQGNGSKYFVIYIDINELINYYTGSYQSTGVHMTPDAWQLFELHNFNWTAGIFDIYMNDTLVKTGAGMYTSSALANIIQPDGYNVTGANDWVDDFIVRNYNSPEPSWGSWGAEETN